MICSCYTATRTIVVSKLISWSVPPRPHERGVQPVRRTGAHEYHRGPWISKFKIEMGNYSSKTLIQGFISDWSLWMGPSLDWCIWVCMGPMADWSLSLHVDGPLFRFVRAVVCRGLEIVWLISGHDSVPSDFMSNESGWEPGPGSTSKVFSC